MLHQLATEDGREHGREVEPEPLLVDEFAALSKPLTLLNQYRSADGAGDRHRVGGQLQRPYQRTRRFKLSDKDKTHDGGNVGGDQVALSPIAEQRHKVGKRAVDRLYDPGEIENRQVRRNLQRRPALRLFQVITERLGNQAADLTDALDDINKSKEDQ